MMCGRDQSQFWCALDQSSSIDGFAEQLCPAAVMLWQGSSAQQTVSATKLLGVDLDAAAGRCTQL
jgi:hypothetical protein